MSTPLFLLLLVAVRGLSHVCVHDDVQRRFHIVANTLPNALDQGNASFQPIRIAPSFLNLDDPRYYCTAAGDVRPNYQGGSVVCAAEDVLTPSIRDNIVGTLVPSAIEWLSRELSVVRSTNNISVANGSVCDPNVLVPANTINYGVDADYALFVTAAPVSGNTIAWAVLCSYDVTSGRPLTGIVNFNVRLLSAAGDSLSRVVLHELHHALGFSYDFWVQTFPSGTIVDEVRRGASRKVVTAASVVGDAQRYFSCASLTGPELEDEGGQGTALSHWERRSLRDELMSGIIGKSRLTNFTLSMMESLGFYAANRTVAEEQWWFAGSGCGGHSSDCNTAAGGAGTWFCFSPGSFACTPDRLSGGSCATANYSQPLPTYEQYFSVPQMGGSTQLMNYCPVITSGSTCNVAHPDLNPELGNYYGVAGRCVTTTPDVVQNAYVVQNGLPFRCLRLRCPNNSFVQFQIGSDPAAPWTSCPINGSPATVSLSSLGYRGSVVCPTASAVCADGSLYYGGPIGPVPTPPPSGSLPTPPPSSGLSTEKLGLVVGLPIAAGVVTLIVVVIIVRASRSSPRREPPRNLDRHFVFSG